MTKGEALADFLEDRGVRFNRTRMGWQKVSCFGAGHIRGDRNPSLSINLTTGRLRCWSCGLTDGDTIDIIDLIQREQSLTYSEALTTLKLGKSLRGNEDTEVWL